MVGLEAGVRMEETCDSLRPRLEPDLERECVQMVLMEGSEEEEADWRISRMPKVELSISEVEEKKTRPSARGTIEETEPLDVIALG